MSHLCRDQPWLISHRYRYYLRIFKTSIAILGLYISWNDLSHIILGLIFFLNLNLYLEKSMQLGIYVVSKLYFLKIDSMYIDGIILVSRIFKNKISHPFAFLILLSISPP